MDFNACGAPAGTKTTRLDEEALAKLLRNGGPKLAGNMVDLLLLDFAAHETCGGVQGRLQGFEDAMHPLRTCAGHVGALAVRTVAVEIEALALAGDSAAVALRLAALEQAFHEVKPQL